MLLFKILENRGSRRWRCGGSQSVVAQEVFTLSVGFLHILNSPLRIWRKRARLLEMFYKYLILYNIPDGEVSGQQG
jgi:hypothetical protein